MAVETQTISTAEIKPIFSRGTSTAQALGTAHEDAHTFFDFPIISYSLPYHSSTLEVAPNYSGHSGQMDTQMRHRQDLNTWNFDVSFFGTAQAILSNCLWAFGDGASACELTPAIGIGNGVAGDMQMKHGVTSKNHATIIFRNGGTDATVGVRTDADANNLILALPLVGNALDVSNQINSGSTTKVASVSGATADTSVSNFYGGCFNFDGSNDKITIAPTNASDFTCQNDFTIEGWIYVDAFTTADAAIFSNWDSGDNRSLLIGPDASGADDWVFMYNTDGTGSGWVTVANPCLLYTSPRPRD